MSAQNLSLRKFAQLFYNFTSQYPPETCTPTTYYTYQKITEILDSEISTSQLDTIPMAWKIYQKYIENPQNMIVHMMHYAQEWKIPLPVPVSCRIH